MRLLDYLLRVIASAANTIKEIRKEPEFSCGDCERQQRCGLTLKGSNCTVLAIQISRDNGKSWKREKVRSELRRELYRYWAM